MANDSDTNNVGPEIVSAFPLPPSYFSMYENGPDSGPAKPSPMHPTFHLFGTKYTTSSDSSSNNNAATLVSNPLYESTTILDYKAELKKLNHSILANFIEFIDDSIKNNNESSCKLKDLETLFLNVHQLINTYRPHQARETLIEMLRLQIARRQNATAEILNEIQQCKTIVADAHSNLLGEDTDSCALEVAVEHLKNCSGTSDTTEENIIKPAVVPSSSNNNNTDNDNLHREMISKLRQIKGNK